MLANPLPTQPWQNQKHLMENLVHLSSCTTSPWMVISSFTTCLLSLKAPCVLAFNCPHSHRTAWPGLQLPGWELETLASWSEQPPTYGSPESFCSTQTRVSLHGLQWARSSWLSQATLQTGPEIACRQREATHGVWLLLSGSEGSDDILTAFPDTFAFYNRLFH